jgi:3-oxoacyl-[acyl-carrier-protein] synthase-3
MIEATAGVVDPDRGVLDLTAEAGLRCLSTAGVELSAVDILIYTGVYRDQNILEPAVVHLVQERMGLNLDPDFGDRRTRTLSFDIFNGECGFLNAVQAGGSMLANGAAGDPATTGDHVGRVLVVAGDSSPSGQPDETFPFVHGGGAALLRWDSALHTGFGPVAYRSDATTGSGIEGGSHTLAEFDHRNRSSIVVAPSYAADALALGADLARAHLDAQGVSPDDVDVVVATRPEPDFGAKLASAIGAQRAVEAAGRFTVAGDTHSASPVFGFDAAAAAGVITPGSGVLFCTVGAGLTAACSFYRA